MNSRGFTLIELLVVISIIGMMSSVTLNAVNSARGSAESRYNIDAVIEYGKAAQAYKANYGTFPTMDTSKYYCIDGQASCLTGAPFVAESDINVTNAFKDQLQSQQKTMYRQLDFQTTAFGVTLTQTFKGAAAICSEPTSGTDCTQLDIVFAIPISKQCPTGGNAGNNFLGFRTGFGANSSSASRECYYRLSM